MVSIKDLDVFFEELPAKVFVLRNFPAIDIAGEKVGPLEEGKEVQIKYWIAEILAEAGIVQIREKVDKSILQDLYFKEVIQSGKQLSPLPEHFFPKLRRYLREVKKKSAQEYEDAVKLVTDIMNARGRKIVDLAIGPPPSSQLLQSLSKEERILYTTLRRKIGKFRSSILKEEELCEHES